MWQGDSRVISKIFLLVCLLFMGNNEFNLIFVVGGVSWTARHGRRRKRRAGYHDRKKLKLIFHKNNGSGYPTMPTQKWTKNVLKLLFGSPPFLYSPLPWQNPQLCFMLFCAFLGSRSLYLSWLPSPSGNTECEWKFPLSDRRVRECSMGSHNWLLGNWIYF